MKGEMANVRSLTRPESGEDVLCSHVEFHESLDLNSRFVVVGSNGLRTQKTDFLASVEMELDWGGGLEFCGVDQSTEDLDGIDGSGTILTRRND